MQLLLIGLNHRTTPVDVREQLHLDVDEVEATLRGLTIVDEAVILSTCNRLEFYAVVDDVDTVEPIIAEAVSRGVEGAQLYVKQGKAVARHLLRVASGLDSMILGEAQILGQVSDALGIAEEAGAIGITLRRLFHHAIHAGRRARTNTEISRYTTSVSHAAAYLLRTCAGIDPSVLIIGAGDMAELAAQASRDSGIEQLGIVNRTWSHTVALADRFEAEAHPWSRMWDMLAQVDAVITTTGAPHPVLYAEDLQEIINRRMGKPLVIVDIALPRDVDPRVRQIDGIALYDIDDLQEVVDANIARRKASINDVEAIINDEIHKFTMWRKERRVVPVIVDMRREIRDVIQAELENALGKLPDIDDHDEEVLRRMAHRITNKVLHSPTISLREHAVNGEADTYAYLVRQLFNLEQRHA